MGEIVYFKPHSLVRLEFTLRTLNADLENDPPTKGWDNLIERLAKDFSWTGFNDWLNFTPKRDLKGGVDSGNTMPVSFQCFSLGVDKQHVWLTVVHRYTWNEARIYLGHHELPSRIWVIALEYLQDGGWKYNSAADPLIEWQPRQTLQNLA